MRTLLQAILACRNVLGQQGHEGYAIKTFTSISSQRLARHAPTSFDPVTGAVVTVPLSWIHANNPSVLLLVAQMLESTHEYRCRLRFLRMLAVGRSVPERGNLCKLVWAYLDDLSESPRDVLPLLSGLSQSFCNRDLADEISSLAMKYRRFLAHDFVLLEQHQSHGGVFAHQIAALKARFADALDTCDQSCEALANSAVQICRLAGEPQAFGAAAFDNTAAVLRSLNFVGSKLKEEMWAVQEKRRVTFSSVQSGQRSIRRRWKTVDTSSHLRMTTHDPDLIRQLRDPRPHGAKKEDDVALASGTSEEASPEPVAPEQSTYCDLVHGGPAGVYNRDPASGRWGRRLDRVDGTSPLQLMLGGPNSRT
ncbi:unnamed protein product [Polarella glacialis]|uniref:Uncharacterized protein n=1 Tax=Polarella glacialis TaxID=89957 RepID=A0A813HDX6_POLGL|nr:unnamed protein product [Polarella glacialis]